MKRFEVPDGWVVQAFDFALDPAPGQAGVLARQFGGRRYAYNWAVRALKNDIEAFHAGQAGPEARPPSMIGLRKRWNQAKDGLCVDAESGEVWWPTVSKEAFADGIKGAVDGYWRWQHSRAGTLAGKRVGSPGSRRRARTPTGSP